MIIFFCDLFFDFDDSLNFLFGLVVTGVLFAERVCCESLEFLGVLAFLTWFEEEEGSLGYIALVLLRIKSSLTFFGDLQYRITKFNLLESVLR
jgi:hypothetical protein